ncbi:MAG: hypothetical protein ACXAEU_04130 [Candidatus Hodarchaeales archaeon]
MTMECSGLPTFITQTILQVFPSFSNIDSATVHESSAATFNPSRTRYYDRITVSPTWN